MLVVVVVGLVHEFEVSSINQLPFLSRILTKVKGIRGSADQGRAIGDVS